MFEDRLNRRFDRQHSRVDCLRLTNILLTLLETPGQSTLSATESSRLFKQFSLDDLELLADAKLIIWNCVDDQIEIGLTREGEEVCAEALQAVRLHFGGQAQPVPHWDPATRVLSFEGKVVKSFCKSAPNQERLLARFQTMGWPEQIHDPLLHDYDVVPSVRLRETIKRLNRTLEHPLIRFRGDGTGLGVRWQDMRGAAKP